MRLRLAAAGVLAALAAVAAPAALAAPTIRLTGTSASGDKNLRLAIGTMIDTRAYRITTRDRSGFVLGGGSDLTLTGATAKNTHDVPAAARRGRDRRDRRRQATHWSWDITKLADRRSGPTSTCT